MTSPKPLRLAAQYVVSCGLLCLSWEMTIRFFKLPGYLLPHPIQVANVLYRERSSFIDAATFTLTNMAIGAAVGIVLGAVVGTILAYSRFLRWLTEPSLVIFQSFPRESLFPLLVIWLGFGATGKIVSASLLPFFPTAVLTLNGLTDTRADYLNLIRAWGGSRFQEFVYCRIPAFVPGFVGVLKVALPLSLIGAVLGEFMGGSAGLGYIIMSSGSNFRIDRVFAAVAVLAATGGILLALTHLLQTTFLKRFSQEESYRP